MILCFFFFDLRPPFFDLSFWSGRLTRPTNTSRTDLDTGVFPHHPDIATPRVDLQLHRLARCAHRRIDPEHAVRVIVAQRGGDGIPLGEGAMRIAIQWQRDDLGFSNHGRQESTVGNQKQSRQAAGERTSPPSHGCKRLETKADPLDAQN